VLLSALVASPFIYEEPVPRDPSTRTRQRVIDPFFAAWLRGEG
jgi:hypothetical protein